MSLEMIKVTEKLVKAKEICPFSWLNAFALKYYIHTDSERETHKLLVEGDSTL